LSHFSASGKLIDPQLYAQIIKDNLVFPGSVNNIIEVDSATTEPNQAAQQITQAILRFQSQPQ